MHDDQWLLIKIRKSEQSGLVFKTQAKICACVASAPFWFEYDLLYYESLGNTWEPLAWGAMERRGNSNLVNLLAKADEW